MKHKRQTLGKQGDDGDDKDSVTSDGGKSTKMSDKFLDDEMSKKSCQGCEMPSAGICGSHDEIGDMTSNRGNNNNTPSATNNNTSFNNNSNGASSVTSSGSFDKGITEEDSRSNEGSGSHNSLRISKKSNSNVLSFKTESRKNSPNTSERKISLSKMSPSVVVKDQNLLLSSDSAKTDPKALSTVTGPNLQRHNASINIGAGASSTIYPQIQNSPPASATAVASATVTIQNLHNTNIPPFTSRGSPANSFQYNSNNHMAYSTDERQSKHQQYQMQNHIVYGQSDMYHQGQSLVNEGQPYIRNSLHLQNNAAELSNRLRSRQNYESNYHNQNYFNYPKTHGEPCNHSTSLQIGYHDYQSEHSPYGHYNYQQANMYQPDAIENSPAHISNPHSSTYYSSESIHHLQKPEFSHKPGYYENNSHGSPQTTPNSETSGYMSSEVYTSTNTSLTMNSNTAAMVPPTSVQIDSRENYAYHQYYSPDNTQAQVPPTVSGENSNSSSDFNFLSNLANDYTPEYYQI